MFNSGGAVEQFDIRISSTVSTEDRNDGDAPFDVGQQFSENRAATAMVVLGVRGCGRFGFYSTQRPIKCTLDSSDVQFSYDSATGLVILNIPVPEKEMYRWALEIQL